MTVATKSVAYLARQIAAQKSKYIFLLGAGVSVTAGIPAAAQVVDRLLDRFWLESSSSSITGSSLEPYSSLSDLAALERGQLVRTWALDNVTELTGLRRRKDGKARMSERRNTLDSIDWASLYSTCLALLPGEEIRQRFIVECIKEGKGRINFAHLLMSQLIVNNFVRIVLTTNFDDILLRALQLYFEIPAIIDADSTHTLMAESSFSQVAYLHGRLSSYRQRHTQRELREAMPDFESFMVSVLKDHGLVVVGYRGGDEAPMKILTKVLEKRRAGPGGGLFWVSYERESDKLSANVQRILRLKDTYWLGGWDADSFFENLCASPGIGLSLPDFLCDPKKFAKRLEAILPEKARGPWSEFQEFGPIPTGSETESNVLASEQARLTAPPAAGSSILSEGSVETPEERTPEEITAFFERSASPNSIDGEGYREWGHALSALGRDQESIEKYRRATELNPFDAQSFSSWGEALQRLGLNEEAAEKYSKATELDPENASAFALWGQVLERLGHNEEAVEKYRKATELNPEHAWAFSNWGQALERLGRNEEAMEKYSRATQINPYYSWPIAHWGHALQTLGRVDEALEKYRQATELNPEYWWAFGNWGQVLQKLGRNEEALEKYRQATELNPKYGWAFANWGSALQKLGRDDEALEKYRQATELNPNIWWAFANWGKVLQKLGRDEEALEKYRLASELNPKSAWAFANWGKVLQILGRDEEALEKYQHAAEVDPNNAWNVYHLGQALQRLRRLEAAIVTYQRAIDLNPKQAAFRISLAGIYRRLGWNAQYEEQIKISRELLGNQSEYNLACFESVCGNHDQAIARLSAALQKEFHSVSRMARIDPDLDFVRDDPRFQKLLTERHAPKT
jgi:tetratricopeptide (TPR) repeat protein